MVVQEEDDAPLEVPLSKRPKKYVVVKNHVREILPVNEGSALVANDNKVVEKSHTVKRKQLKRKKSLQKVLPSVSTPTDITKSDLEELRTVYRKCKVVLQKIESKYGHLLDLEGNESHESSKNANSESSYDYCSCSHKKKIIFDEKGKQIEKDCQLESHICIKKIKKSHVDTQPQKHSVQVEYEDIYANMPNDLQELENILKDDNINKSYRRMVIDRIYLLRQEYLNEIRYAKHDIIKQLKANVDEVLNFKGTNLSSLQGYPTKPMEKSEKSS